MCPGACGRYDKIDFAESAVVPLSSVKHPAALIGSTAVDLLIAESQNLQLPKQQIVYRPEIVERASSGPRNRSRRPETLFIERVANVAFLVRGILLVASRLTLGLAAPVIGCSVVPAN